jgi:hypothetical protein
MRKQRIKKSQDLRYGIVAGEFSDACAFFFLPIV